MIKFPIGKYIVCRCECTAAQLGRGEALGREGALEGHAEADPGSGLHDKEDGDRGSR